MLLALAALPPLAAAQELDGPTIYRKACAPCHGADGRGVPMDSPLYANFDRPPADFSDPLFNSREPAADWLLVTAHGGKRLGLSAQMPAFGEALSEQQIEDVVAFVKTLADTAGYPPGDLNFLRPIAVTKAFPEDEALIINSYESGDEGAADALSTTLYFARRIGRRHHGEVKLKQTDPRGGSGTEETETELELELKSAVAWNAERLSIHTLGLELVLPLEGDGSEELIPYWSFGKGLSDDFSFQSQLAVKLPFDDLDGGSATLEAIVHWLPSRWPRGVSPALEATVTEPFASGADTVATVLPQLYFGLSRGGHVALAVGAELPLTDEAWEYRVRTFLLWDIADGAFWKGW